MKILFINYNLKIDTHNEPDIHNVFRGCSTFKELYKILFEEKIPNSQIDFCEYKDIFKIKTGYYYDNINLSDYNFVYFGFMSKYSKEAVLLMNYLTSTNVPFITYETFNVYDSKSFGMDLTESLGYKYIPTILTTKLNHKILKEIENFGFPLIVKDPNIDQGKGVFKIDNIEQLKKVFIDCGKNHLMIQKFIPNDGDNRVIVIKNKVELVVKRKMTSTTEFRSNVALGGKAVVTDLPKFVLDMCVEISKNIPVCDILGFDIIEDISDGSYYVMEINISPHISTFCAVSGVDIPGIIVNYMIEESNFAFI